jgi:hypothetical protein
MCSHDVFVPRGSSLRNRRRRVSGEPHTRREAFDGYP